MAEIFVGSVAVGVVPSAQGFAERVRSQIVPSADSIGAEFGGKMTEGISSRTSDFMTKWGTEQSRQAKRAGSDTGASYAESFRAKLDEILRNLPEAKVDANTTEAQDQINKLRAELESLKSKEIGVDLTNAEAMSRIDEIKANLTRLVDHPSTVSLNANITAATAKVDELRKLAAKPIVVPVEMVESGNSAKAASAGKASQAAAAGAAGASIEADMAAEGEKAGNSFGSRFSGKVRETIGARSESMAQTREGMVEKLKDAGSEAGGEFGSVFSGVLGTAMKVGVPVAIAGAVVAIAAVMGEKLEMAQKQLEVTLKAGGQDWEAWKDKVKAAGDQMSKFGYTQDQVDGSIRKVYMVTGSMTDAIQSQGVIADIAASRHIDLASATQQYDKALVGGAKQLKEMGIVMATGTTQVQAMSQAQKILASQVESAGGMAKFAALHHISLAEATKLVAQASGPATGAAADLAKHNLTAASAATLLTAAQSGNSAALKTLGKDHLSLAQLQNLVTQSSQGNIAAFNKLGIDVIPKSNTAAQNFAETNRLLESRMGGQAQAVAESFGGKIAALRAKFTDVAMEMGTRVMPYLGRLIDMIIAAIPVVERWVGKFAEFIKPAVGVFLKGIGDIIHVLVAKYMRPFELAIGAIVGAWVILDAVMAINPFVALTIAIIFIIGLIDKYHKQIVAGLVGALHEVENAWHTGWNAVKNFFVSIWDSILNFMKRWGEYFLVLFGVAGFIALAVINIIKYHRQIENFIVGTWNAIWKFLVGILNDITGLAKREVQGWQNIWNTGWRWIHDFFIWILNAIEGVLRDALGWISNTTDNSLKFVRNLWSNSWTGIKNLASAAWGWLKNGFHTFFGWLENAWTGAVGVVKTIWNGIKKIASDPVNFIIGTVYNKGIVKVVDAIAGVVGMHPLNPIQGIPGFARGTAGAPPGWAWVGERGPELVRMTGGETVLPHEASMATGLWGSGAGYADGIGIPGVSTIVHDAKQVGNAAVSIVHSGLNGLRTLVGDALGAGINKVINPLINDIPDLNTGLGQIYKKDITWAENKLVQWIIGQTNGAVSGGGTGSQIAAFAKQYATGRNHPYVTGGASPSGWDCSGMSAYVYEHFGYFPEAPGHRHGTSESQWVDGLLQSSGNQPGALVFFDGTGYAPPGHVGVVINPRQYVSAYDHAMGTVVENINGSAGRVWGYRIPKGGFHSAAGATAFRGAYGAGNVGAEERWASGQLHGWGWGQNQMGPLIRLWNQESGWNPYAVNASSGAYGIPQALGHGHPYNLGDWQAQIRWGLAYIFDRYGSPANAWAHEQRFNWYADGTKGAAPGWAWVGERGMELVNFRGGEQVMSHEDSMKSLSQVPGVGYWNGTAIGQPSRGSMSGQAHDLKAALRDVEMKLDKVVKATQGVGGDVASSLNGTGRIAGQRGAFNSTR